MNSKTFLTNDLLITTRRLVVSAALIAAAGGLHAQAAGDVPTLEIQADQVAAKVSPTLYGLMTEEINYSYDGGLYAELVRNRSFKESAVEPRHWLVNTLGTPQPVRVVVKGINRIAAKGESVVLAADSPKATNSIDEPTNVVPVTGAVDGLSTDFTRSLPPYSVTILKLRGS